MNSTNLDIINLFEDTKIWPIQIVLPRKRGYTLWGTDLKGNDVFLSQQGKILFFKTLPALFKFIKTRQDDNFFQYFFLSSNS